jgi:hypothetical protein
MSPPVERNLKIRKPLVEAWLDREEGEAVLVVRHYDSS